MIYHMVEKEVIIQYMRYEKCGLPKMKGVEGNNKNIKHDFLFAEDII
jgi:hypothetical protein